MSMSFSVREGAHNNHREEWRSMFGSMIQDRREAIQRSVEDSARLAGMTVSEWAAIEAGLILADPAKLRPMADALEVRFDQMAMLVHLCQEAWAQ